MQRRWVVSGRAVLVALGTMAAALPVLGAGDPASARALLERRVTVSLAKAPAYTLVQLLHEKSHAPLSFIDAGEGPALTIRLTDAPLAEVLQEVTRQNPSYRVEEIEGHVVLRAGRPEYDARISGIELKDVPRFDAASRYVVALRRQQPFFASLAAPPQLGNPASPVFTEKVSLSGEGTVVRHLVELLGDDPDAVFLLVKAKSGVPMLALAEVK